MNDNVEVFVRDHVDDAMEEIIMQEIKWDAVEALRYLRSKCYTAADKLAMCVKALEEVRCCEERSDELEHGERSTYRRTPPILPYQLLCRF